jgi:hypothetical protein
MLVLRGLARRRQNEGIGEAACEAAGDLGSPAPKPYLPACFRSYMAENKSPSPKRTEIMLAWLGSAVALLWWLVAE